MSKFSYKLTATMLFQFTIVFCHLRGTVQLEFYSSNK